jgi:hypothetical protein
MLGTLLYVVGIVLSLIGGIWILVLAFRKSILWGLLCLFISPIAIVFAIQNWAIAKRPFLIEIAGVVLLILGAIVQGMAASSAA